MSSRAMHNLLRGPLHMLGLAVCLLLTVPCQVRAGQQVPGQMSYQGYLRDSAAQPVSGSVNFQFYIYDSVEGGAACWGPENHADVPVVDGLFELTLGEITPIPVACFDGSVKWLETWVNGTQMLPRKRITSAAYAMAASTPSLAAIMNSVYPVGTIYTSVVATNPHTLFGVGTWVAFGAGRVLVGIDGAQTEFDAIEKTGGEKVHTLTMSEMPAHTHKLATRGVALGSGVWPYGPAGVQCSTDTNDSTPIEVVGGGAAHNNLQPYLVVYFFKRIE